MKYSKKYKTNTTIDPNKNKMSSGYVHVHHTGSTGLTSTQRSEVGDIVDGKLSNYSFKDTILDLLKQHNLEHEVRSRAESVVPKVCESWVSHNLASRTEMVASNFMRENFAPYFRKQIAENKEVTGFIDTHLREVEGKVKVTASDAIRQIVGRSQEFRPIFDSHLNILRERADSQLRDQMSEFTKSKTLLEEANKENTQLREKVTDLRVRVKDLEEDNSTLKLTSAVNFMGVVSLGLYMFFGGRSRL